MKIRIALHFFFILMFTVSSVENAFSQNDSFEQNRRKPLIGLNSIEVRLPVLDVDAELAGLTGQQIQKDVELQLSKSGIRVEPQAESYLVIDLSITKVNQNTLAYSVLIVLNQKVILERDKSISVKASTWAIGGEIEVIKFAEVNKIKEKISDYVGEFISVYLSANPDKLPNLSDLAINKKSDNSPFTATYVGGNRPPEVEIFNDSDRTLYLDFGQDTLTPYTIPPKTSKKFTLTEGIYKYKATAPRVVPLAGEKTFEKGYRYTWRFVIVTRKIN